MEIFQALEYIKKIYLKNRLSLIFTYFFAVIINFSLNYFFKIDYTQNTFTSIFIPLFFNWISIFLIAYLAFKTDFKLKSCLEIISFFITNLTFVCILSTFLTFFYSIPIERELFLFFLYFSHYIMILFIEKCDLKTFKKSFLIFILLLTGYHYFYLDSILSLKISYCFLTPLCIFYLLAYIKTNKKSIKFYGLTALFIEKIFICFFLTFLFVYLFMESGIDYNLSFSISIHISIFIFIYWDRKVVISIDTEDKTLFLYQGFLIEPIIIDIFDISDISSYDHEYYDEVGRNVPFKLGKAPIIILKDGTEYKSAILSKFETSIDELKNIINDIQKSNE